MVLKACNGKCPNCEADNPKVPIDNLYFHPYPRRRMPAVMFKLWECRSCHFSICLEERAKGKSRG
jgi:hypothetical protein